MREKKKKGDEHGGVKEREEQADGDDGNEKPKREEVKGEKPKGSRRKEIIRDKT